MGVRIPGHFVGNSLESAGKPERESWKLIAGALDLGLASSAWSNTTLNAAPALFAAEQHRILDQCGPLALTRRAHRRTVSPGIVAKPIWAPPLASRLMSSRPGLCCRPHPRRYQHRGERGVPQVFTVASRGRSTCTSSRARSTWSVVLAPCATIYGPMPRPGRTPVRRHEAHPGRPLLSPIARPTRMPSRRTSRRSFIWRVKAADAGLRNARRRRTVRADGRRPRQALSDNGLQEEVSEFGI